MGHIISKKRQVTSTPAFDINAFRFLNRSPKSIDLIASDTTVKKLFNKLTNNETNPYFDFNRRADEDGNTFLHLACEKGNVPIVKALLYAGASVNAMNDYLLTPLDLAIRSSHLKVTQLLIKHSGFAVDSVTRFKEHFSSLKISENSDINMNNYLVQHNIQDFSQNQVMFEEFEEEFEEAFKKNHIDLMTQMLTQIKVHISQFEQLDFSRTGSITRHAVREGKFDLVKLFVKHGGLVLEDNIPTEKNISSLSLATQLGHYDIAKYLAKIHEERYTLLKQHVDLAYKYELFMFGLFKDKNSKLHTCLGKQADISDVMLKRMISYEF